MKRLSSTSQHLPRQHPPRQHPWRQCAVRQRGQGMTEYIIIVALIAIAAIAVYQYFGQTVRNQTAAVAQELAGEDGNTARTNAQTSAQSAETQANDRRTLQTFVGNEAR